MAVYHLLDCDNAYLTGTETHLQNVDEFLFHLVAFFVSAFFILFCFGFFSLCLPLVPITAS